MKLNLNYRGSLLIVASVAPLAGCAASPPPQTAPALSSRAGVLVMAHGGSSDWNAAVEAAIAPLEAEVPIAIAFGMARRETLQEAMDRLTRAGVGRVAVVRVFLSGSSFLHATQFLLGVREDPPAYLLEVSDSAGGQAPEPIETRADVAIEPTGLSEAPEIGSILRQRVESLSRDPANESVLLAAHGMSTEKANRTLVRRLDSLADLIRSLGRFREVRVETLREDWPEPRARAERRIRAWILRANEEDGRAIVVPVRLFGFGPYREVLAGLEYVADEKGLVPHPLIGEWVRDRAAELFCENGWPHPLGDCRESPQARWRHRSDSVRRPAASRMGSSQVGLS
jgi:sirohydrochlorin ferrochelatase